MKLERSTLERMARRGIRGDRAHAPTSHVFAGLDWTITGSRPTGTPHTLYQLLLHMSFWQDWVLQWLDGKAPVLPTHAAGGWPGASAPATQAQWLRAVRHFRSGLTKLAGCARQAELLARHRGLTRLEMLLTIGAHNSYHAGQVAQLRQMLGAWPPPSGGHTW